MIYIAVTSFTCFDSTHYFEFECAISGGVPTFFDYCFVNVHDDKYKHSLNLEPLQWQIYRLNWHHSQTVDRCCCCCQYYTSRKQFWICYVVILTLEFEFVKIIWMSTFGKKCDERNHKQKGCFHDVDCWLS